MMNQESQQDFHPQEIPPANSSHEYGGGSDSAVPLPLNGIDGGFTVLQLPQPPTSSSSAISDSAIQQPPLRKCTSCGFGSAKKRSPPPSSLSSLYQPSSKRPAISSTTSSPDHPTPPSSSERKRQRSPLPLRRSLSDFPCSPIGGAYYQDFPNPAAAAAAAFLKNPLSHSQMLPGNSKISRIPLLDSQDSFPLVPLSNPSSSSEYYDTPPVNTTPPRPPPSSAPLRRSLSDFPCSPVGGAYYQDFPNPVAAALKYPSPPSQMPLHRSPSYPSSSSEYYEQQAVNTTPSRPRPAAFVRPQMFDHHHGSPNSKKLRRELKVKVEELMQAVCEQEEDDEVEDEDEGHVNINCINKEEDEMMNQHQNQNENEGSHDESVWVKQTEGGGLILHFKCPCGEGYEVFLHGDKCYYRLS